MFGIGVTAVHVVDDSFVQPEAGTSGGLDARPREYERRVVAFFDQALLK